jgi:hypothetical protein
MVTGVALKQMFAVGGSSFIPTGFIAPARLRTWCACDRPTQRHFQRKRSWYPVATTLHSSSEQLGDYLRQLPPFLPAGQVRIAFGTAAVTAVMLSLARMAACRLILASQDNKTQQGTKLADRRSLQAVYLLANSGLAAWGIVALMPMLQSGVLRTSTLARAQGHVALGAFGSVQVGFSIWSIVTDQKNAHFQRGRLDEETVMLLHHLIIVFVGMLLATCTLGFRAYAPFFCGLVELSSVPLVVMKELAKGRRRKAYHASRVAFAATFLATRVVAWLFVLRLYVMDLLDLISLSETKTGIAVLVPWGATIPLLLLTLLQLRWGLVIVNGVAKMVYKSKSTTTSSSS